MKALFSFIAFAGMSAQAATVECPATVQSKYFSCPAGTDCRLLKNDITNQPFSWNGEPYLAEIQVTVDSSSCTGFPKAGSESDLYLAVNGVELATSEKPATVIKLGISQTINLIGAGPIRIYDKDPVWTLGYQSGSFCDIKISCTDALSVSTANQWLSTSGSLADRVNLQRIFLEKEQLLTYYYDTYIGDKTTNSWLREEAERMIDFGEEAEVVVGEQIVKMLDGASRAEIFKPFDDARTKLNADLIPLETWEAKLSWALNKANQSQKDAIKRVLTKVKDARNPPQKT
jgi:hypothetical protein